MLSYKKIINRFAGFVKYHQAKWRYSHGSMREWYRRWPQARLGWKEIINFAHVPYTMFQYTPNVNHPTMHTNNMGFRGNKDYSHLPSVKPDPAFRYVVLLGNSTAFGALCSSDEQCVSAHIERMLNSDKSGKPYRVINLACGFYNSFQDLQAYILYGLKYNPEIVITLNGYLDAWVGLKHKVPMVSANYFATKETLEDTKSRPEFQTRISYNTAWDHLSWNLNMDIAELFRRNLLLIWLIAVAHKSRVILCLQPLQVDAQRQIKSIEMRSVYPLLQDVIRSSGVEYIDLHDLFSNNPEYNKLYSYTDPIHLIDKGHEVMARRIVNEIKRENLPLG